MNELSPLPKYRDDLGLFLGDLRSSVFASQSKMAQYARLSHTTISRYENGLLLPPAGYIAHLAYLVDERLAKAGDDATRRQSWLLTEVNAALRSNYADAPLFGDWLELKQVAQSYLYPQSSERRPYSIQAYRLDWGEAPDVSVFYGRDSELTALRSLILDARCRLVVVAGIGGIGKTLFVTRLAHEVQPDFRHVIWRSLRNAPSLAHTIQELSASLFTGVGANLSQSLDQQTLRLLEFLQAQRCLVVLDNLESIMGTGDNVGAFQSGYEDYRVFLNTLATVQHQSCVLITTREVPAELSGLTEQHSTVQTYNLSGVSPAVAEKILSRSGISGSPEAVQELNRVYSGNPMALKLVTETINNFFGRDIGQFLESQTIVFNDIRHLLDQSFDRLSTLFHEVLYWLAIERQPLTLNRLVDRLVPRRPIGTVIDVLQSLCRCSLVERYEGHFYLPSLVAEYVIDRLIHQIAHEMTNGSLYTLHRVPLLTTDSSSDVRQAQIRLIVDPLAHWLISELGDYQLRATFAQLVGLLHAPPYASAGFAAGNLLNIMRCAGCEIRGCNFSGLTIQHALMTKVSLIDVDFSQAQFVDCLFDNTFIGVNTVALSKKGQFLALASGSEIRVWRLSDREPYRILTGHHDLVWDLKFAQDERYVYGRDASNTIHLWNIETSRIELTIQHHTTLNALAVSQDAAIVAAGSVDGSIYLWDGQTGQAQYTLRSASTAPIRALVFNTSAQYLAAGDGEGNIVVWDLAQSRTMAVSTAHDQAVTALAFASSDTLLVSGGVDGAIKIWRMGSLELQAVLNGHEGIVSAIKTSPDGRLFASSSYDRTIRLWDIPHNRLHHVLQGHELPVSAIDLDETGHTLVSGSYDRTVCIWNTRDAGLIDSFQGLTFDLRTLAFSADSELIAGGSSDYHVYLWHIHSGTRAQTLKGHTRWISAVAFHPTDNLLASGSYDRTIRIWQAQEGKERAVLSDHSHWVTCVCFSQDGRFLASGSVDQTIRVWDVNTFEPVYVLRGHEDAVHCLAFHPQFRLLASGGRDKTVRLWNLENGTLMATLPTGLAPAKILCFATVEQLVCVTQDERMLSWSVPAGALIDERQLPGGSVAVSTFSGDGQLLAGCSTDRIVTVWDVKTGQIYRELHATGGKVFSLAFDRQAQRLASGSIDGWGNVWDIRTGESIRTFKMNRPYEGMNITGATGISAARREMLKSMGAVDSQPPNP